jgi:CheY-like chemotaxis protein
LSSKLEHILYADDDEVMRTIVQMALENLGQMRVSLCEDGSRVLEMARRIRPQLILMDVKMPGQSGPQAALLIQQDPGLSGTPIVLMTGERDMKLPPGVCGIITKPVDPVLLTQQVQNFWSRPPS